LAASGPLLQVGARRAARRRRDSELGDQRTPLRCEGYRSASFSETDPGFHERCKPGDIIVAGRNFGMGPKMNGYIAMQALGLGLVCESMPFLAYRAAIGCGLRVMTDCVAVADMCDTGDDLEVDFRNGFFMNHTRNITREYPPIPDTLLDLVELGGNTGWLKRWWEEQSATTSAPT
jgi:3-isopropylmalate/(R)-2-methylmalate dehydratase small subunit